MILLHATTVTIDGRGVLVRGPSGSGTSDLALRLIDRGARLGAIILTGMVCAFTSAWAEDIPIKVTEREAYQLLHKAKPIPKTAFYDGWRSPGGTFYSYGLWSVTREGSGGYFAVNPWTGDVWDLWACGKRYSTPALRKAQAAIRKRFTPAEMKEYPRLRDLDPGCSVG
jgi:hypothetical protein